MSQILGSRLGLTLAALAAATFSGAGSAEVVSRPPQPVGYSKPTTRAWGRFKGRPNPAGTKLWRQAMAGACTLRGRVTNGDWEPER